MIGALPQKIKPRLSPRLLKGSSKFMCKTNDFCVCAEMLCDGEGNISLIFRNTRKEAVCTLLNITTNEQWARELCDRCNAAGLSEVHIMDVIEDSLG